MKKQTLLCIFIMLSMIPVCTITSAQNLIASYPLNGNANDISGNGLNGTTIGSPQFVPDRFGNANSAIQFPNYTAHRIEVDDNNLFHVPSITISAWVKEIGITSTIKTIVDKPQGTGTSDSWHFGVITNGGYVYSSWIFNDPGTVTGSQITAPLNIGDWHYVVTTFDNNSKLHKLYVDGILRSINTFNSTIGYDNNKIYIGAALENNSLNFPMDGELDDIKIYDGALTAQQIANEYSAGISYNNTGSGNAVSFNGVNDNYAQLPSLLDGTNIFTVDFWVKTTNNDAHPLYWVKPALVGNANPTDHDGDFGITLNNGQLGIWSGINSSGDNDLQTAKAINDDKWHHVAVVSDGSNMVLYADGVLLPGSISTAGGTLQTSVRPWRIGMNNSCCSNGFAISATIDEFRVWNAALTQSQIRDRMCRKINNSDALYGNLVADYHFDETNGYAMVDSKNNNNGYFNSGTRLTSGAPIGNASAYDFTNAVKTATLSHAGGESFTVTSASGNPDGIMIYRIDEQPNTVNGVSTIGPVNKYFGVFQSGGTSPQYNAVYNYTGNPDVTAGNENTLALYKRTDNSVNSWTEAGAVLNMSAKTLTVSGQSTEYVLGSRSVVAVKLLSFDATKKGETAVLQWKTTNEINTSHFETERSTDGIKFEKTGSVNAINANGIHNYSFTDNNPAKGINYYRLKQVDIDNRSDYSRVAAVIFDNKAEFSVYPDPALNTINIKYTGDAKKMTLTIFDAAGEKVLIKNFANKNLLQADVSALAKGVYTVQLNDGSGLSYSKLIKL